MDINKRRESGSRFLPEQKKEHEEPKKNAAEQRQDTISGAAGQKTEFEPYKDSYASAVKRKTPPLRTPSPPSGEKDSVKSIAAQPGKALGQFNESVVRIEKESKTFDHVATSRTEISATKPKVQDSNKKQKTAYVSSASDLDERCVEAARRFDPKAEWDPKVVRQMWGTSMLHPPSRPSGAKISYSEELDIARLFPRGRGDLRFKKNSLRNHLKHLEKDRIFSSPVSVCKNKKDLYIEMARSLLFSQPSDEIWAGIQIRHENDVISRRITRFDHKNFMVAIFDIEDKVIIS